MIEPTIIGKKLKEERQAQGISLEEIAQKTRIRMKYLAAIEAGETELIPSPIQLKGFLRLYAGALGLEIEDLKVQDDPTKAKSDINKASEPRGSAEKLIESPPQATISELQTEKSQVEKESSSAASQAADEVDEAPDEDAPHKREEKETFSSQETFQRIGKVLKERRELLSLSIKDIAAQIKVKTSYLEAIENGQIEKLPSPVQAKGMISNYAAFLNLDQDAILLTFAEGLQKRHQESLEDTDRKKTSARTVSPIRLKLKTLFSLDLLVIALLFIGFATFVIWGVNRILATSSPNTQATDLPEVAEVLLATGTPTGEGEGTSEPTLLATDTNLETTQALESTPLFTPAGNDNPIQIVIQPRQRVWVEVTVDDELVFDGRLIPGNAYDYSGNEKVEILTGNAAALQLYFNDQDIGAVGVIGEVMNLVFTEFGLVLPTPTHTPTITETPLTTPTFTPSPSTTTTPSPEAIEDND